MPESTSEMILGPACKFLGLGMPHGVDFIYIYGKLFEQFFWCFLFHSGFWELHQICKLPLAQIVYLSYVVKFQQESYWWKMCSMPFQWIFSIKSCTPQTCWWKWLQVYLVITVPLRQLCSDPISIVISFHSFILITLLSK